MKIHMLADSSSHQKTKANVSYQRQNSKGALKLLRLGSKEGKIWKGVNWGQEYNKQN